MSNALLDISQEELVVLCHQWQAVLRLQDWDVKVSLDRHFRFSQPGRDGEIGVFADCKSVDMRLLHPRDRPPDCIDAHDIEQTIVHELLHIHFHELSRYDKPSKRRAEEQAITALASAYVRLHRFRPDLALTTTPQHEETLETNTLPVTIAFDAHIAPGTSPEEIGRIIAQQHALQGQRDATTQPTSATGSGSEPASAQSTDTPSASAAHS